MKIMLLNDGETYSDINGCKIVELPDNFEPNDIKDALSNIRKGIPDVNVKVEAQLGKHGEWINGFIKSQ